MYEEKEEEIKTGIDPLEETRQRFFREVLCWSCVGIMLSYGVQVKETIRRGEQEQLDVDNIQLEVSGAKFSHDATLVDYGAAVGGTLLKMAASSVAGEEPAPSA